MEQYFDDSFCLQFGEDLNFSRILKEPFWKFSNFETDTETFFGTQIFETDSETFFKPNIFKTGTETFFYTKIFRDRYWDPVTEIMWFIVKLIYSNVTRCRKFESKEDG